jgi:hypothetical protein
MIDDDLHHLVVDAVTSLTAPKVPQLYSHWMARTVMDKTMGRYYQDPKEQKHLMEAKVASLGSHVGDCLSLLQPVPIGSILLVLMSYYISVGPGQPVLIVV